MGSEMLTCGCGKGKKAIYEVYEDKQPHCELCLKQALECEHQILVRRIDEFGNVHGNQNQSQ